MVGPNNRLEMTLATRVFAGGEDDSALKKENKEAKHFDQINPMLTFV